MNLQAARVAALVSLISAAGPQASATIAGVVLDARGAPMLGVAITILDTHGTPKATTGPDGRYSLGRLTPGRHAIRAAIAGFAWREERVDLKAGETARIDFVLCPALAREINFIGAPPLAELVAQASLVAHIRVTFSDPSEAPCRGEARLEAAVIEAVKADAVLSSLTFFQDQWMEEATPYPVGTELIVFFRGRERLVRLHGPLAVFLVRDGTIQPSKFLSPNFSGYVGRPVKNLLHELRAMR